MKSFSENLIKEMDRQLEALRIETDNPILYAERAVKAMLGIMEKLKAFFLHYEFENTREEIAFFRDIKPRFASRLIYYNEVYCIESSRPFGTSKAVRHYYRAEMEKRNTFFEANLEFYRYYRKGTGLLDDRYFVRGQHDIRLDLDSFYLQADHQFSTSHDYKVARILANELIQGHLEKELQKLQKKDSIPGKGTGRSLKWTGAKVGLVELVYALHTAGVFNHGNADLREITAFFGKAFEADLGQFHRTFFEISARKSERTKFLNSLSEQLVRRMEDRDGI